MTIIGEAFVILRPTATGFGGEAQKEIDSELAGASSLGKKAILGVAGIGAAILAAAGASLKLASDFQTSQAQMQGTAQLTAKQTAKISKALIDTIGSSEFSAVKLSQAFAPVAGQLEALNGKALTAKQTLSFLAAAGDLTTVKMGDLNNTTSDLSQTLFTFKSRVSDAASTANILYNAARITNTPLDTITSTVDKLHSRLGSLVPTLKDAATLLTLPNVAALGSRGVMQVSSALNTLVSTATTAGTATAEAVTKAQTAATKAAAKLAAAQNTATEAQAKYNAIWQPTVAQQQALANAQGKVTTASAANAAAQQALTEAQAGTAVSTNKSVSALQALGIQVYNSKGQFNGIRDIIGQLNPIISKMTQEQQQNTLSVIFGKSQWQIMAGVIKGGTAAWDKSQASVSKSTALAKAAAAQHKTLAYQMDVLKASASDLGVIVGNALLPAVSKLLTKIEPIVKTIGEWIAKHTKLVVTIVEITGAVVIFTGVVSGLLAVLSINPFVLLAAAIVGIGLAIYEMVKHWKEVKPEVEKVEKYLMHFGAVRDVIHGIEVVVRDLRSGFESLPGPLKIVAVALGAILFPIVAVGIAAVELYKHWHGALTGITDATNGFVVGIKAIWNDFLNPIVRFVRAAWSDIESVWQHQGQVIRIVTKLLFDLIVIIVKTALRIIMDAVKLLFLVITPVFKAGWAVVKGVTQAAWDLIVGVVKVAWRIIETVILVAWDLIGGIFKTFGDIITGHWSRAWNDILSTFHKVGNDLLNGVKGIFNAIVNAIGRAIIDIGKGAFNAGKALIEGLIHGIKEGYHLVIDAVKGVGGGIIDAAKKVLGIFSPSKAFFDVGANVMQGFANGITANKDLPQKAINNVHIKPPTVTGGPALGREGLTYANDVTRLAAKNHESLNAASAQLAKFFTDLSNKEKDKSISGGGSKIAGHAEHPDSKSALRRTQDIHQVRQVLQSGTIKTEIKKMPDQKVKGTIKGKLTVTK